MKTVLFACVHNAGRSQMAAALFNAMADPALARAVSAGTEPAGQVHPEVVAAMREEGIDLSNATPRRLTPELAGEANLLVTLGCGEACPVLPGLERRDWPLADPRGQTADIVRTIREEVRTRVTALLDERGWRASRLRRELGTGGAIMMGLGSIVGTGVFVSLGVAAGIAGPAVVLAIALAALVAAANGLSSAQLAASHPVSGGTYEYGYRYLAPALGFLAGWMFLCAKSASAATAALGFAGYLLDATGLPTARWLVPAAVATVALVTALVLSGLRRSNAANIGIVSLTLLALVCFVLSGLPLLLGAGRAHFTPFFPASGAAPGVLHATALMFVAYTGYGRIATLGEEVREPRRTIPRAIGATLVISMLLYLAVGAVAVGVAGAPRFARATLETAAPLEVVARQLSPGASWLLAAGAMTAMLGVLLNLVLGLSRVLLAMGRRGDMPAALSRLDAAGATPTAAVLLTGAVVAALALSGNVRTTWSFSAFTVLVYYALTNLAALRLPAADRLYPRWVAVAGLFACSFLAFWVEPRIWLAGLGLLAVGLVWHLVARGLRREGDAGP